MTPIQKPRRIPYPGDRYPDVWVELPAEWLGEHLLQRDQVIQQAEKFKISELLNLALALRLADAFSVPGLEGDDPAKWDFTRVPIPVIAWLTDVVLIDFGEAFAVPKAPSGLSPTGTTETSPGNTVGSSAGPSSA